MMIYGNVGFFWGGGRGGTEEESRQCWSAGTGGRIQKLGVGAVPAFVWIFYLLDKTRSAHSKASIAQSTLKNMQADSRAKLRQKVNTLLRNATY